MLIKHDFARIQAKYNNAQRNREGWTYESQRDDGELKEMTKLEKITQK